jgi:hypothetical protein
MYYTKAGQLQQRYYLLADSPFAHVSGVALVRWDPTQRTGPILRWGWFETVVDAGTPVLVEMGPVGVH